MSGIQEIPLSVFFGHFSAIFIFSLKNHDFSKKILKNSKKPLFDFWGPLGWVPYAVLALNQWIRPKKRGTKKSVHQTYPNEGANHLNFLTPAVTLIPFWLVLTSDLFWQLLAASAARCTNADTSIWQTRFCDVNKYY